MKSQNIQNGISIRNILNCDLPTAYIWIMPVMVGAVSNFVSFFFLESISPYITMLLYLVMLYIIVSRKRQSFIVSIDELFLFFLIILSILLTILLFPDNSDILLSALTNSYISILFYFAGKATRIDNIDNIYVISFIGVIIAFVSVVMLRQIDKDMTYSYTILPYSLVSIHALIHRKKAMYYIGGIMGLTMLFFLSTRGPLFLMFVYTCFAYISNHRKKWRNTVVSIIVTLSVISYFQSSWYSKTLLYLYSVLESKGIHNQMLYNYFIGSTASTDNRIIYMRTILAKIRENPLLPHGLCGDRLTLQGTYVHNIICEILYSYGGVIGLVLIIAGISRIISILKNSDNKEFIICLLFAYLGKLFFSSSFVIDTRLYFMIGAILGTRYRDLRNNGGAVISNNTMFHLL